MGSAMLVWLMAISTLMFCASAQEVDGWKPAKNPPSLCWSAALTIAQAGSTSAEAARPNETNGILLKPIPEKVLVLTFDDSCVSHAKFVGPLLKKFGFGATFYVTTFGAAVVDETKYMSWAQIKALQDMGFEIGNHSVHHLMFNKMSVEECTRELMGIEALCLANRVAKPTTLCWPMYRVNNDFLPVLAEKGYVFGRCGNPRFAGERPYDPTVDNPFITPSFSFNEDVLKDKECFAKAAKQATAGKIVVFTFHGVPDLEHPGVGTEPATFEKCMQYLKDNQYTVLAMRDIANYVDATKAVTLLGRKPLPPRTKNLTTPRPK